MTTGEHDHDALREQLPVYAIGALSGEERVLVESHVRGCTACAAELSQFASVSGALAQIVPQHDPPAALRARVLASAGGRVIAMPARRPLTTWAPWLAAAAMLLVTIGLGGYAGSLRTRVRALEAELREALLRVEDGERRVNVALRAAADAQTPLSILIAPDVRRIDLAGQPVAPSASARTFWSRSRGVVLTAANLPALPAGRTYQLWFVRGRTPVSVGLVKPDANGRVTAILDAATNLPDPDAVAVTIEPEGGVPAPTGDKYLVGLAH
jgi:anti-sigma-K factor RskA